MVTYVDIKLVGELDGFNQLYCRIVTHHSDIFVRAAKTLMIHTESWQVSSSEHCDLLMPFWSLAGRLQANQHTLCPCRTWASSGTSVGPRECGKSDFADSCCWWHLSQDSRSWHHRTLGILNLDNVKKIKHGPFQNHIHFENPIDVYHHDVLTGGVVYTREAKLHSKEYPFDTFRMFTLLNQDPGIYSMNWTDFFGLH